MALLICCSSYLDLSGAAKRARPSEWRIWHAGMLSRSAVSLSCPIVMRAIRFSN